MPSRLEGIGGLIVAECAEFIDISAIFGIDDLVAVGLRVERYTPELTVGIDIIFRSLPYGIAALTSCLGITQIGTVGPDYAINTVFDHRSGEHIVAVGVALTVGRSHLLYMAFDKWLGIKRTYHGIGALDGALEVAALHSRGLVGERGIIEIGVDKGHRIVGHESGVHVDGLGTSLGEQLHHLYPGTYLRGERHGVGGSKQLVGGGFYACKFSLECCIPLRCCTRTQSRAIFVDKGFEFRALLGAAQAVGVLTEIHIIGTEGTERLLMSRCHGLDSALPRFLRIVCVGIPKEIGTAVDAHSRSLGIFHGI